MRTLILAVVLLLAASPLQRTPTDEALRRNNLGVGLMDAGTKDPKYIAEAVREFEAALALAPDYGTARLNLGLALYFAGQTARAGTILEQVVGRHPDTLPAHFVLGLLREFEGRFDDASPHFRRVVERDAGDPDAWYHLGFCLARTGRHDEAVDALRKAVALTPYQRRPRYALFMALTRAGRSADAQKELEAFRALDSMQLRLVDGPKTTIEYLKQGRYAEAVADSRRVAPPAPPPQYVEVGRPSGVSTRAVALDPGVEDVLRGNRRPAAWYANTTNRAHLRAAAGAGAAMIDYNNDGRLDLHIVRGDAGQRLLAQQAPGRFADTTIPAGVGRPLRRATAAAWGDLDNDGWTDLVVAGPGRLLVMKNHRGRFRLAAPTRGLRVPTGYTPASLSLADVDHDGDLDIAVAGGADLARPRGTGSLRYPHDFEAQPNLLLRNNSDGTFTDITRQAGFNRPGPATWHIWFSDVNDDRAIDGVLLDGRGGQTVLLNRKDGSFVPGGPAPATVPPATPPGEARAYGDFDGDGAVDELVVGRGEVRLHRNTRRPSQWLTVRVQGYAVPGKLKSNRLGIGTKVEVRSAGVWERREIRAGNGRGGVDAAEATFDLGTSARVDFVRAIFPSGVRKTVTNVASHQVLRLEEPLLDVNSCPTLFTWNGSRFEFITDTLSAGILGELVAPGQYWNPDPDEWVRIDGRQLVPRGASQLEVRFTNPLEEVTYLDQVKLMAVDHPDGVEVYSDERMRGLPENRAPARAYAVERRRAVAKAVDHHGHEVTAVLAARDRRFFEHFAPRPFKGFAGDWALTLDVGPLDPGARPVLGLEGWTYWNSSAAIVAASQAGEHLWGPILEVRGAGGVWRLATDDLGLPAGLPRTVLIDLTPYLRPGERVIRIRANRTIYYDQIWVGEAAADQVLETAAVSSVMRVTRVPLDAARLQWLGYPRRRLPDGHLPEVFDYEDPQPEADWGTHAGWLTRYGDVRPLVVAVDSRFVVMGHGEEVALTFDGASLPPLGEGWRRTFFFYANGFEKGYELHSAHAETVDPLPYQGMPGYPHDESRAPRDTDYERYLFDWNSRPAFLRPGAPR